MFSNKRKLRRHSTQIQRKSIVILAVCVLLLIGIGSGVYVYLFKIHKQMYVSPIASACKNIKSCLGTQNSEPQLDALKKMLAANQINFTAISDTDGAYTISLQDGSEVLLSDTKDLHLQISSLQYIISRLTMEGRQFKKLDLRFDKPVITF